jgi:hypothetical protein
MFSQNAMFYSAGHIDVINSDKPALQENLQSSWQAMNTNLSIYEEINKHPLNRTGDNMELSLVTDVAQNKNMTAHVK